MDSSLRNKIVVAIKEDFSKRFRVIDNTKNDKKIVFGTLPDVILMRPVPPANDDILFVMRIEDGRDLVESVMDWKDLSRVPAAFYIVLPEDKLSEAKKLIGALGIYAKFASYQIMGNGKVKLAYE